MDNIFVTIITLIIAFVSAQGFWDLINYLVKKRKGKRDILTGIEDLNAIYAKMSEINELGGERVILFAGHNSGGVPRAHSPFYVSALHGSTNNNRIKLADYQNLQVDSHYIRMLLDCEREGIVDLQVDGMPDCQLKDYYLAEGVLHSLIVFLGIVENKFLYMSISRYSDKPFTETEITRIRLKTQQITNVINRNNRD